jgi:hypothetical protein
MKIIGKDVVCVVQLAENVHGSSPIRLRIANLAFGLTSREAASLASHLIGACEQHKQVLASEEVSKNASEDTPGQAQERQQWEPPAWTPRRCAEHSCAQPSGEGSDRCPRHRWRSDHGWVRPKRLDTPDRRAAKTGPQSIYPS